MSRRIGVDYLACGAQWAGVWTRCTDAESISQSTRQGAHRMYTSQVNRILRFTHIVSIVIERFVSDSIRSERTLRSTSGCHALIFCAGSPVWLVPRSKFGETLAVVEELGCDSEALPPGMEDDWPIATRLSKDFLKELEEAPDAKEPNVIARGCTTRPSRLFIMIGSRDLADSRL